MMDRCNYCGKSIKFINRKSYKPLVVNSKPVYFIPDNRGTDNFIHDGVMRRGSTVPDGLLGYKLHKCEVK